MNETKHRVADAPPFGFASPNKALLDDLATSYTHITGDPVRTERKRNFVATCYRVHGDDFLPLVQRLFVSTGTVTNLLGQIRAMSPSTGGEPAEFGESEAQSQADTAPPQGALPGREYGERDRPAFNPQSNVRYDRRSPRPEGDGFFDDEELGVARRSPTAEALSR